MNSPGSDEAISNGCLCAVLDNAKGEGFSEDANGFPLFVINSECPLHGVRPVDD